VLSNGFSGKLLPAHLKPESDELLSSWLARLAIANGLEFSTFVSLVWPNKSKREFVCIDVDGKPSESVINTLAEKTATTKRRVSAATLSEYTGRLFEEYNAYGNTSWILPISIRSRIKRNFGLQFCPICLLEDNVPYFRRSWRLAFVVLCPKHGIQLLDRCPECGGAINFHRYGISDIQEFGLGCMILCYLCRIKLPDIRAIHSQRSVEPNEIKFQEYLITALCQGWIEIPTSGPTYALLYFKALHKLMSILSTGERSQDIRQSISLHFGIRTFTPHLLGKTIRFERFDVTERRALIGLAKQMLVDWPNGFIEFCIKNRIWRKALWEKGNSQVIPFWYWKVLHENLDRSRRGMTDEEFINLLNHIRKSGRTPKTAEVLKYVGYISPSQRKIMQREGLSRGKHDKTVRATCPRCHKTEGQSKCGLDRRYGVRQRFFCRSCQRSYVTFPITHGYPESLRRQAARLYHSCGNYRYVGRTLSVSPQAVMSWVKIYRDVEAILDDN
jgi:transposase-like protein